MTTWRDLATDPPIGDEYCVLLFPCKSDVGILYTASNPHYAIERGIEAGYTHWAKFDLAPTHDEWVRWQEELTDEYEAEQLLWAEEYDQEK